MSDARVVRAAGAEVTVKALKKRGVITAVLKPGVYRVQVGSVFVSAREDELDTPPAPRKRRRAEAQTYEQPAGVSDVPASLDLHGLTVEEARNRVAGYISRAILAGHERVDLIHGIGSGKLKAAITKDLKSISAVRAVKPHPTNPGVTIAYL